MKKVILFLIALASVLSLVSCDIKLPLKPDTGLTPDGGNTPGDGETEGCAHEYDKWTVYEERSGEYCDEILYFRICEKCKEIEWRQGSDADHALSLVETVTPTCGTGGYDLMSCLVCGKTVVENYVSSTPHNPSTDFYFDTNSHWQKCTVCMGEICREKHIATEYGKCAICNAEVNDESYFYYWDTTDLIFQLTENSNQNELSSTLKRYLAGEDFTVSGGDIDDAVAARNTAAESGTKVKVKYTYLDNTSSYEWGKNVDRIFTEVNSGATGTPDMYCNFAYDMTCVSLKNAFANLYSTAYGRGMNFFRFIADDYVGVGDNYFDANAGEGYFFDYMKSLTLSDDKAYCLASNYCIDMVRAFLVIPVNIDMMNQISVADSTGDKNGDNKFDVSDFYELVWAGDFTYDALATLAEAVYQPTSDYNTGADLGDVLGFAAGTGSGLTSSGLLYTTDVKIIEKTPNGDGTYTLSYPETNDKFGEFGDALTNLFQRIGICAVSSADANAAIGTSGRTDLECIRQQFTSNNLLFGGVISVGSLEDVAYQDMRLGSGFGIAPVPLYKESDAENPYMTLVHNIARIIAISRNTSKFEQCTAFLNYQSVKSADIITAYYEDQLTNQVAVGEAAGDNVQMLNYIRNNVRDCFDKTYEDVISEYYKDSDSQAMGNRWHGILQYNNFQVTNLRTMYDELRGNKQKSLETLLTEWNKLP